MRITFVDTDLDFQDKKVKAQQKKERDFIRKYRPIFTDNNPTSSNILDQVEPSEGKKLTPFDYDKIDLRRDTTNKFETICRIIFGV